ncbi:MAG: helix-turn-helix transcriptional regulator [Winogradskyella sp.]|uniref:winged helix-turn-helix transcriptional regulator n=1 Tax=Winogradskyella sp. TaxID=1883156 RepID=UPI0025E5570D|nr:helix-turn-helix domain-containing protein [Winogradskyella sp.]NRB59076.1 helix-turn-helix transcriptional regulator [Winogradskyella sp.]
MPENILSQEEKLFRFEQIFQDLNQCPVTVTLKVIGGKWKPAILYLIDLGINRFGEMHRRLPGISKRMLTDHLRELENDGILHREVFAQVPPKVVYTLTEKGDTLTPIFKAMEEWGTMYGKVENEKKVPKN